MSEAMLIAPGSPVDRDWVQLEHSAYLFAERQSRAWTADPLEELEELGYEIRRATLRRYMHPSWMMIMLPFYVDDRIGTNVPDGYVMPGWIMGEKLEHVPCYRWVRNRDRMILDLLAPGQEEPGAGISMEYARTMGEEQCRALTDHREWPPIPDWFWRPIPLPEPEWIPKSVREIIEILDEANRVDPA